MACKPIVCKVCKLPKPACQVKNGVCASCRAIAEKALTKSK